VGPSDFSLSVDPAIVVEPYGIYRLATSREEATHLATRFQCHFHRHSNDHDQLHSSATTFFLEYPFDYEYVMWRKTKWPMVDPKDGKDMSSFWLSQLLFPCPIPESFQELLTDTDGLRSTSDAPPFHLDLIPI
jgi:hypothetical protein